MSELLSTFKILLIESSGCLSVDSKLTRNMEQGTDEGFVKTNGETIEMSTIETSEDVTDGGSRYL